MGVESENTCAVPGKRREEGGLVQDFIFSFCVWCKSRELGGQSDPKIPSVTLVMETFAANILCIVIPKLHEPTASRTIA